MTPVLRVGHIDLSFHDASAMEVEKILTRHGHSVERSAAPHEEMFSRLARGDVDLLVSAWLPASHERYLAPIRDHVRALTILYEPYCIWGVPDCVPTSEVASVSDLLRPTVLSKMERLIQGINPGAGISRFSAAMITEYGLNQAGYHFESGTEADCFDRFEAAARNRRWIVVPLWHPQYLHSRYVIRALEEPRGLLGGIDQATLMVRLDAEPKMHPAAIRELTSLHLGNARVSALDAALREAAHSSRASV